MFKRTGLKTWVRVSWRDSQMLYVWEDEPQSPPQQTTDCNLTLLLNVSIIVCLPDGHLCENTWLICLFQSPVLSLYIRNHHCHLIFKIPSLFSSSIWAPLQHDGCDCSIARGTETDHVLWTQKHLQRIEIRHQKSASPALISEQTNNVGAPAPAPPLQSHAAQRIQRRGHTSSRR